jgi:Heterokaryon incompatibility protein (HET)
VPPMQEFPSTASNADLDKIYAPLESVKREIRLLKTISGLEDEPLRCSLEVISLEDNARYSALSYCWGDANDRVNITVNEQNISVTKTLENALRRIRNVNQNTVVWADAICINQQDAAEKSVQVGMMGDIYSNGMRKSIKGC